MGLAVNSNHHTRNHDDRSDEERQLTDSPVLRIPAISDEPRLSNQQKNPQKHRDGVEVVSDVAYITQYREIRLPKPDKQENEQADKPVKRVFVE